MKSLRNHYWLWALLLVTATVLAYQPAWNGKPIWDDNEHLTKPELRSVSGLVRMWAQPGATQQYYPLVFSAFWVQHKLWGNSTLGYHLVNILLHSFSALLVVSVLRGLGVPGSWLAAAIFALHPIQVESVAWMTELKNTLSGFLFFSSVLVYLRFDQTRKQHLYISALSLFIIGLAAKTAIATLPAAILVIFWWQRGKLRWKHDIWPLVPFFVMGLAAGVFTALIERRFFGAEGSEFNFSFIERCLIAGRSIFFHLGKLFWPTNLTFMYPRWQVSQEVWWQYLFPAAVTLLLTTLWLLRHKSRGPLAGMLFFTGMLFPALGFFNAYSFCYSFVNDHHQYLAGLGIITIASAGITIQLRRWELIGRLSGVMLSSVLLVALGTLTWRQSRMYSDMEMLWRTTIARNPDSWMAHNNLGNLLVEKGQVEEALQHLERAVVLNPDDAVTHYNFGTALFRHGEVSAAIEQYQKALEVAPRYAAAHGNLGNALAQKGRFAEAATHFEEAVKLAPTNALGPNNLAWFLATCPDASIRNGAKAVETAQQAVHLSGENNPMFIGTLAAAFASADRFDEAVATGEKARNLAMAMGQTALADRNARLLELYRARRPYIESPVTNVDVSDRQTRP